MSSLESLRWMGLDVGAWDQAFKQPEL